MITASSPTDALTAPFSTGRLNLWNTGHFHNPAVAWPVGSGPVALGVGVPEQVRFRTEAAYNSPITDYIIFRQSDLTGTTAPLEPGGTKNWVQSLFSDQGGTPPFFDRSTGQTLLADAGVTAAYNDLGDVSSG